MPLWHKLFADMLNVVIIVKTNLKTGATARVVLFSSDLGLTWDKIIEYYRLRFQIEFNASGCKATLGAGRLYERKINPGIQRSQLIHVHGKCIVGSYIQDA